MQSKKHSLIESCLNVFSGMMIAFMISQLAHMFQAEIKQYIWSGFEWNISVGTNLMMTTVLTIVSISRGYAWRRYFNNRRVE
jgi:hypothetical protein